MRYQAQNTATATVVSVLPYVYIDFNVKCLGIFFLEVSAYITGSNFSVKKFCLFFQAGELITENHP